MLHTLSPAKIMPYSLVCPHFLPNANFCLGDKLCSIDKQIRQKQERLRIKLVSFFDIKYQLAESREVVQQRNNKNIEK